MVEFLPRGVQLGLWGGGWGGSVVWGVGSPLPSEFSSACCNWSVSAVYAVRSLETKIK